MHMGVQHGNGHEAWTCHAAWTYSRHAAWTGTLQHEQGHAAWTMTCNMDLDMQHKHGHGHGQDFDINYYWTSADS